MWTDICNADSDTGLAKKCHAVFTGKHWLGTGRTEVTHNVALPLRTLATVF